jgi:SAM-dependent methyltransferase
MNTSPSIYDSARLAAKYAHDRPPVHQHIIRAVAAHLQRATRVARALDIGCGAGLSTAALVPLAESVVGLEPVRVMLTHRHTVAPHARFLVGRAEALPFPAGAFDLLAAAGSLNYADLGLFLPEAARVLAPGGVLVIYDFSAGRRLRGSRLLEEWFAAFERAYPSPPDYDLDVKGLAYDHAGLRLEAYEDLEVAVPMDLGAYVSYALGETNVEAAVARGVPESEIRDWCRRTLAPVFGEEVLDVVFDCYIAYVRSGAGTPRPVGPYGPGRPANQRRVISSPERL